MPEEKKVSATEESVNNLPNAEQENNKESQQNKQNQTSEPANQAATEPDKEATETLDTDLGEEKTASEDTAGETETTESPKESAGEKKGMFGKKEKKDRAAEQIAELNDKVKRQMAEFDNFRKRTEKEKSQMYEIGAKSVIEKILPVVDNLERGLDAVPKEAKEDPFVQGMEKIYKQFLDELSNIGVKPIEAVGEAFNPDLHNAVMQVAHESYESGTVAQELQKGYTYRDSVVRHSMVGVVE
ncbi:nucleotide exchange factor GrpE [Clostridia bacterium]|nr:nucleotide exchange factor GrpE [Clostridia bacterium]